MAVPVASIVTFNNSYAHLPTDFFLRVKPTEVVKPRLDWARGVTATLSPRLRGKIKMQYDLIPVEGD